MSATAATVIVNDRGELSFVWDDALAPLRGLGATEIHRVSHVEPTIGGQWTADLSPIGGPLLGPFDLHAHAIEAEKEWVDGWLAKSNL